MHLLRPVSLLCLLALLAAGPRHVAPSLMQERLVAAMLAGAGPQDLCGMTGEAAGVACVFCLPPLVLLLPDGPGPALALRCAAKAVAVLAKGPPVQDLRFHGPGQIRGPPGMARRTL